MKTRSRKSDAFPRPTGSASVGEESRPEIMRFGAWGAGRLSEGKIKGTES